MSIPIKLPQDFYNLIINRISVDADSGIATYPHSSSYDLFVKPLGDSLFDINVVGRFIYATRSLDELKAIVMDNDFRLKLQYALNITGEQTNALVSEAIDNLASNWNETRRQPSKSKGFVRMYFNTSIIPNIPQISISTSEDLSFITTTTFNAGYSATYDTTRNLYYIDSSVEATETGSKFNVESGTINITTSSISGLVSITNQYRTVFGRDLETDLEFIERIKTSWRSRKQSTVGGLMNAVISYPNVEDVSVIMPGTDLSTRLEKNAVDVYIINSPVIEQIDAIYQINSSAYAYDYPNKEISYETYPVAYYEDEYKYKLLNCPANSVVKVEAGTDGVIFGTTISINDYSLIKDTTGNYANSVKANDLVSIKTSALTGMSYIKITYDFDKQFYDMQNIHNTLNYAIIGADILYKKALPEYIDIDVSILTLEGYVEADVKTVINSDLNIFFNGGTDSRGIQRVSSKLGGYIDASDLLNVILDVEGVDRVDLSTFSFSVNGDVITGRYTTPYNSYLLLGSITYTDYPL